MDEGIKLLRRLIEVTIASEVPTDSLYADYRPKDAMEYLGMKPKSDDTANAGDGENAPDGAEAEEQGPGNSSGAPFHDGQITFDNNPAENGAEDNGDEEISASSSSTQTQSALEHVRYTARLRHRKMGL